MTGNVYGYHIVADNVKQLEKGQKQWRQGDRVGDCDTAQARIDRMSSRDFRCTCKGIREPYLSE
jgi:hypothetical protein